MCFLDMGPTWAADSTEPTFLLASEALSGLLRPCGPALSTRRVPAAPKPTSVVGTFLRYGASFSAAWHAASVCS